MVSIIIPTYNREKTILRAINSVLEQTYNDIEVIIVDDGSKDNTREIIESLNCSKIKSFNTIFSSTSTVKFLICNFIKTSSW